MINNIIRKIRNQENWFWSLLYKILKKVRRFTLPSIPGLSHLLLLERSFRNSIFSWIGNQYASQIMPLKCKSIGGNVCWGGVPWIYGTGEIYIGSNVSIVKGQTWIVGFKGFEQAILTIGDNSTLNFACIISVAKSVSIGKNVRIAGGVQIYDNNSHPIDCLSRRDNGGVLTSKDVEEVVIDDDVWIGANCIILKGVHIGLCSIVAAGSVVTKDVLPNVIVAGNPARVVKKLD